MTTDASWPLLGYDRTYTLADAAAGRDGIDA
jgi:hypothetical protein